MMFSDFWAEDMTVDHMVATGEKPTTNKSLKRGIEYFDRMGRLYDGLAFSPMVTGFVLCTKPPLETVRLATAQWETLGVQGIRPFYLRSDFATQRSTDVVTTRTAGLTNPAKKNADFGHATPYDADPLPEGTDFRTAAFDRVSDRSCPTLHLTPLAVKIPDLLVMTIRSKIGPMDDVRVDNSRLVLIPTIQIRNKEIQWSFLASVYCWRIFQMEPFAACTEKTQSLLRDRSTPVVRHFASILQDALDAMEPAGSSAPSVHSELRWIEPGTRL